MKHYNNVTCEFPFSLMVKHPPRGEASPAYFPASQSSRSWPGCSGPCCYSPWPSLPAGAEWISGLRWPEAGQCPRTLPLSPFQLISGLKNDEREKKNDALIILRQNLKLKGLWVDTYKFCNLFPSLKSQIYCVIYLSCYIKHFWAVYKLNGLWHNYNEL